MTLPLKYDAARAALAECRRVDEVKDWLDKAAAVREYARRAKDRVLELDALEIRERARRRRGELLLELKADGRLAHGSAKPVTDKGPVLTLEDLDTSKNDSARDQKLAQMDGDSFERLVARCRAYMEEHPEKHSFASMPQGPINGARAIMGSRQEPDDSLDYFPTPPWATRALALHVLPAAGIARGHFHVAWEPACGEGHIAEVLAEYSDQVIAADVFDYGYGDIQDFLEVGIKPPQCDWLVTNPPFGDKGLEFVIRALSMLDDGDISTGVAMFFRSQWAVEGIERYEEIFRDRPPTLCAFFVERVNLCKGRWDPEGSTATAYCWLVWMKAAKPRPPFWIPPGCRESLTHPDDVARFTAHPVIRKEAFDPTTGEVTEAA